MDLQELYRQQIEDTYKMEDLIEERMEYRNKLISEMKNGIQTQSQSVIQPLIEPNPLPLQTVEKGRWQRVADTVNVLLQTNGQMSEEELKKELLNRIGYDVKSLRNTMYKLRKRGYIDLLIKTVGRDTLFSLDFKKS